MYSFKKPPSFSEGSERLSWRESVKDWCDNVIACAAGGDHKDKVIAACLPLKIYRSLRAGAKEQVKQTERSGEIVLTTIDSYGPKYQTDTVNKILEVVTNVTAVDCIERMVCLNKKIQKCIRGSNKTLKEFVA